MKMPAAEVCEKDAACRRVVDAIQRVRRQKQRPTAERVHRMLERDGHEVSSGDIDQLLDHAVNSGSVERIFNTSGVVSYKELTNVSTMSSSIADIQLPVPETSKRDRQPQSKNSELQSSKQKLKKPGRKPSSVSRVSDETVSADCKPVLVIDKHSDLSDVVLQVILRLGCATGKAVEKDIRSHYRLDIYPGVDIRRLIRTVCKSLVRQEQLRQQGNNFVLLAEDDDAADVTLTVDEPTNSSNKSSTDTQVAYTHRLHLQMMFFFFEMSLSRHA